MSEQRKDQFPPPKTDESEGSRGEDLAKKHPDPEPGSRDVAGGSAPDMPAKTN